MAEVNVRALNVAVWSLEYATAHLEKQGRGEEAKRLAAVCGVQVFTIGELLAVLVLTLHAPGDVGQVQEIALNLAGFRRGTRVFTAKKVA